MSTQQEWAQMYDEFMSNDPIFKDYNPFKVTREQDEYGYGNKMNEENEYNVISNSEDDYGYNEMKEENVVIPEFEDETKHMSNEDEYEYNNLNNFNNFHKSLKKKTKKMYYSIVTKMN